MNPTPRALAAGLLLTAGAAAQLLPDRQFPIYSSSPSLATGDLNGDGLTDLVTGGFYFDFMSVLLRAEGGGLQPYVAYEMADSPSVVKLGDLDADGALDVVATSNALLSARLGDGQGAFLPFSSVSTAPFCYDVALTDVDGDGDDDAAAISLDDKVHLFLSNGLGGLLPGATMPTGDMPVWIEAADVDGDADADLVVVNLVSNTLSVLLGNGAGGFTPGAWPTTLSQPYELTVGDIDEDGDADLLVNGNAGLERHLGAGDGSFAPAQLVSDSGGGVTLADVDGDGWQDLVHYRPNGLQVELGGLGPDFHAGPPPARVPETSQGIAILDASGDGQPDFVLGNATLLRVTVLRGTGFGAAETYESHSFVGEAEELLATDLDGDADVDVALACYGYFGPGGVAVLLNDGAGALVEQPYTPCNSASDLDAGDVDADGDLDLLGNTSSVALQALLGDGSGHFTPQPMFGLLAKPRDAALGDVDGDGDADAVGVGGTGTAAAVTVFLADGTGGFGPGTNYPVGLEFVALRLADYNLDGDLDGVALSAKSNLVQALPGEGNGVLGASYVTTVPAGGIGLAVGALDDDGFPDLATVHGYQASDVFTVSHGNGTGQFTGQTSWPGGALDMDIELADVDGDGRLDLLGANWNQSGSASVLLNDGAGGFLPVRFHVGDDWPTAVAAADLDGHGRGADVLVLSRIYGDGFGPDPGQLTVLRNLGPPETWMNLGSGKAGGPGIPMLVGHGPLLPGQDVSLELRGAAAQSAATLVIGLAPLFAPLKGGVLVPMPNFVFPGLFTDADGGILLQAEWPGGTPSGLQAWFQFWVADPAASAGYAASNGVTAAAP